jgi:hypothetical protein
MTDSLGRKSEAKKWAGIISMILWLVGFALAFVIPAKSAWTWTADALLLLGFFPMLFVWKPSWTWIVFGVLNLAIGFILLVIFYLPADQFPPDVVAKHPDIIIVRNHLSEKHSAFTWMFFGIVAIIYGAIRRIKNIYVWIRKRQQAN